MRSLTRYASLSVVAIALLVTACGKSGPDERLVGTWVVDLSRALEGQTQLSPADRQAIMGELEGTSIQIRVDSDFAMHTSGRAWGADQTHTGQIEVMATSEDGNTMTIATTSQRGPLQIELTFEDDNTWTTRSLVPPPNNFIMFTFHRQ